MSGVDSRKLKFITFRACHEIFACAIKQMYANVRPRKKITLFPSKQVKKKEYTERPENFFFSGFLKDNREY